LKDLRRIRYGEEDSVSLPGFDHARGDPEENAHAFRRGHHKIVICEGLYLLHDDNGWDQISECFDLSIFVDANVDTCMDRVKIRNKCIPGYTPEEIDFRVDQVDRKNALTVDRSKERANLVYRSLAF
jgi:pantothenate kinase